MLVNAHVSWRRKRSSTEVADGAARVVGAGDRAVGRDGDVGDVGAETVEREAVWRLITRLPPKQRVTVVLRYYEDLDDVAIAEILGCSPVTVRTHAMRALATLRGRLAPNSDPHPDPAEERLPWTT
jgi:DNA-directed RNA polymerase specialized sigma24 family protein